jgi:hypothetical protein
MVVKSTLNPRLQALIASIDSKRDGQMGLPHPGRPQEDDVLVFGQEGQIECELL